MQRPVGVTILAVLCFIGAAILVICGLVLLLGGAWLATLGSVHAASGGPVAALLGGMGAVAGIIILAIAALHVAVGIGLLGLKSWARILALVLVVFGLALNAIFLLGAWLPGHPAGIGPMHFHHIHMIVRHLIAIAIEAWILYYLFRPHVKQAFGVS